MALISVSHLRKSFGGVAVLKDVNAEIGKDEVISVIGSSGTGKSTSRRCAAGWAWSFRTSTCSAT